MDPVSLAHLALLVVVQLVTAAAIYGGIRADLRNMAERQAETRTAVDQAHRRIDSILERTHHAP